MSHSGASLLAMKVMIVVMVMALLTTTSHCINISGSIVSGSGYSSSSRCNGLTATACRIAYSELDFDLEFMLDSEFSIRLLAGVVSDHKTLQAQKAGTAVSCNRDPNNDPKCHGKGHENPPSDCRASTSRTCYRNN